MIKELGLSLLALTSINSGVRSPSYRSHEVIQGDSKITYKYETNEVNSNDDLIVGNIYKWTYQINQSDTGNFRLGQVKDFYCFDFYAQDYSVICPDGTDFLSLRCDSDNKRFTLSQNDTNFNYLTLPYSVNETEFVFYAVYYNDDRLYNFTIVESDWIPIESVEVYYPDNIFGFVSQFIDAQILNGIPNIDNVAFTIGGQNITMRSWLNTTICVVLACLLIGLLLWFIRYLFRLFGGLLS